MNAPLSEDGKTFEVNLRLTAAGAVPHDEGWQRFLVPKAADAWEALAVGADKLRGAFGPEDCLASEPGHWCWKAERIEVDAQVYHNGDMQEMNLLVVALDLSDPHAQQGEWLRAPTPADREEASAWALLVQEMEAGD